MEKEKSKWEKLDSQTWRMKVPGGWLVNVYFAGSESLCFLPDFNHIWSSWELDN